MHAWTSMVGMWQPSSVGVDRRGGGDGFGEVGGRRGEGGAQTCGRGHDGRALSFLSRGSTQGDANGYRAADATPPERIQR